MAGLGVTARRESIEMRGSYILDAVVCRRRSLEVGDIRVVEIMEATSVCRCAKHGASLDVETSARFRFQQARLK